MLKLPPTNKNRTRGGCGHIKLGKKGENLAAAYLVGQGYTILDRNWHFGHMELDIVCEKAETIIFVEVKTRRRNVHGGPAGAITANKKSNLAEAAQAWLIANEAWNRQCRFDIICIMENRNIFGVEHYQNAFDLSETLDSCDSHRQPW